MGPDHQPPNNFGELIFALVGLLVGVMVFAAIIGQVRCSFFYFFFPSRLP